MGTAIVESVISRRPADVLPGRVMKTICLLSLLLVLMACRTAVDQEEATAPADNGLTATPGSETGGGGPATAQPEPAGLATEALQSFLTELHQGNYVEASYYYGGGYDWLLELNPDLGAEEPAALLARGCELNGLVCLDIATLALTEATASGHTFSVQFANEDGSLFVLGPCCGDDSGETQDTFAFHVVENDGQYLVEELPPYQP